MLFALRGQYSADSMRGLIHDPTDRREGSKVAMDAVGARLVSWYGTAGGDEQGMLAIYNIPDSVTNAAIVNTLIASGAMSSISCQRLYTPEETVQGLKKAQEVLKAYKVPGQ